MSNFLEEKFKTMNKQKLNVALRKFDQFRLENEEVYQDEERQYKEKVINYLNPIVSMYDIDTVNSKKKLHELVNNEIEDKKIIRYIENLLSSRNAFANLDDLRIFLENIDLDVYREIFMILFDENVPVNNRINSFRKKIKEYYDYLFDNRVFPIEKKSRPSLPTNFAGIFLVAFDPDKYIYYKYNDYIIVLDHLEIIDTLKSTTPGGRYEFFLDFARYILIYAKENGHKIEDLIDAHSFIYMFSKYEEFEEIRNF